MEADYLIMETVKKNALVEIHRIGNGLGNLLRQGNLLRKGTLLKSPVRLVPDPGFKPSTAPLTTGNSIVSSFGYLWL